jgi:hypothetical protein
MPFSTASRVVWSLTEEGGSIGVIRYQSHPTDRRKKQLVINQKNLPNEVPLAVTARCWTTTATPSGSCAGPSLERRTKIGAARRR